MARQTQHDPNLYQQLVLDTVLPSDWRTMLSEARRCVTRCPDKDIERLAEVVRTYKPGPLASLHDSMVSWLNGEEAA